MRFLTFCLSLLVCYQSFSGQFNYKVDCENEGDCPHWFAALVHNNGVCSSALVKPDIIATNLHCLPPALAHSGANCENLIEFIFPKTQYLEEERAVCDKVLFLSPPLGQEIIKPDYAFIRLKANPTRAPLEISQKGFPDSSKVTMYKLNPDPTNPSHGVVKKTECRAIQNSIINPYFTNDLAPLVLLTGCPIVKGNSGSPLLLDDEKAHGVVSATMELPLSESLRKKIGGGNKLNFGFGSNFSCLANYDLGFFREKITECEIQIDSPTQQRRADELIQKKITAVLAELETKVNNSAQKDLLAGKPLLLWQAQETHSLPQGTSKDYLLKVSFVPHCLLPKTASLKEYENRLSSKLVSMPQLVPEYLIFETIDDNLRYAVKLEEIKKTFPLMLTPRDLLKKKNIPVDFNQKKIELSLCSELVATQSRPSPAIGERKN